MGGGGGEGPERDPYEEYRDPEPDEEETADEQARLGEIIERAEAAANGGEREPRPTTDVESLVALPRLRSEAPVEDLPADLTPIAPSEADLSVAAERTITGIDVDLNNVVVVEAKTQGVAEAIEVYHALHPEEFARIEQQLYEKYESEAGQQAVEQMVTRMREWKVSSGQFSAMQYEAAFKQGLDIDRGVRELWWLEQTPEDALASVGDVEEQVARDLNAISSRLVQHHLGERFQAYRGPGHDLREPAIEIFDDPHQETYSYSINALENFTLSRAVPEQYSEVIVEQEFAPADVGDAADLFVVVEIDGSLEAQGEVRIRGDALEEISRDRFRTRSGDRPLPDLIASIPDRSTVDTIIADPQRVRFSEEEHAAIAESVRSMVDVDRDTGTIVAVRGPNTDAGKARLARWNDLYQSRFALRGVDPPFDPKLIDRATAPLTA